jgi:hypothetical protein
MLVGCGYQKSPRTMHYAELTIVGSLVGVLASSIGIAATAGTGAKDVMIGVDIGCGVVAGGALVTYLVADLYDEDEPKGSVQQRADEQAWEMTKRAREAARRGDCGTVKKIEPALAARDKSFHDVVFMRDAAIAKCLH